MSKVKVSICCITYNQENYIKEALDSFVSQKTDFKYEIVIHDDASTDNTPNIIMEYHKKYPDLIVPILQKENVYSKNPNSIMEIIFSKAKGEYIALCDGDDGYTDITKIKLQSEYLDKHQSIAMCSHNTKIVSNDTTNNEKIISYEKKIVTITDFFSNHSSMHTSSMMFRKKDVEQLPNYFHYATVADLPLKLHLLSKGNCYHFNKVMSFYRINSIGSWSLAQKKSLEQFKKNYEMEKNVYKMFNEHTNYQYQGLVENRIKNKEFQYYKQINDLKNLKNDKYNDLYKKLSIIEKVKLYIKSIPGIHKLYTIIKYRNR